MNKDLAILRNGYLLQHLGNIQILNVLDKTELVNRPFYIKLGTTQTEFPGL